MRNPVNLIWAKLIATANGFFLQLPNILAGIAFLAVAWIIGKLLARWVGGLFGRRERIDLGAMLGSILFGIVMIVAGLIACAIIFPSVKPSDVLGTLGIGSVAIGFAFKDILQNLLAGLLLLINRPYRRGDQISVKNYEGTVEHIESRATLIKTYDGRRVIIPNSDIYTSPVVVNTAFPHRRDQYDVGVGYGDDFEAACQIFAEAAASVDGVLSDPAPEALPWGLDASTLTIRVRWWTESLRTKQVHVRAKVLVAIQRAAVDHGVDLPYPTNVVLFHDQTEETDGDRSRQREGWPAGSNPPKARRIADPGSADAPREAV
jgi:small-conductance mechanosensitive channel